MNPERAAVDHDATTAKPFRSRIPTRPLEEPPLSSRVGKAPAADPKPLPRSVPTKTFQAMHGEMPGGVAEGGTTGVDDDFASKGFDNNCN